MWTPHAGFIPFCNNKTREILGPLIGHPGVRHCVKHWSYKSGRQSPCPYNVAELRRMGHWSKKLTCKGMGTMGDTVGTRDRDGAMKSIPEKVMISQGQDPGSSPGWKPPACGKEHKGEAAEKCWSRMFIWESGRGGYKPQGRKGNVHSYQVIIPRRFLPISLSLSLSVHKKYGISYCKAAMA